MYRGRHKESFQSNQHMHVAVKSPDPMNVVISATDLTGNKNKPTNTHKRNNKPNNSTKKIDPRTNETKKLMQLIFHIEEETKVSIWWPGKMIHLKAAAVTISIILKKRSKQFQFPVTYGKGSL